MPTRNLHFLTGLTQCVRKFTLTEAMAKDTILIVLNPFHHLPLCTRTLSGTRCHYNVQNNQKLIISTLILMTEAFPLASLFKRDFTRRCTHQPKITTKLIPVHDVSYFTIDFRHVLTTTTSYATHPSDLSVPPTVFIPALIPSHLRRLHYDPPIPLLQMPIYHFLHYASHLTLPHSVYVYYDLRLVFMMYIIRFLLSSLYIYDTLHVKVLCYDIMPKQNL